MIVFKVDMLNQATYFYKKDIFTIIIVGF